MFGSVLTAMVTPFDERQNINYAEAGKIARYLAQNSSDGIVVAGTTGESPNLTSEEKLNLFQEIKQAVGDACKVIAGIGTYSTKESAEMAAKASRLQLDGIMAVVPYYNKPSQEGLYEHFRTIAEATDLPLMLYNVPGRTVTNLLPKTVARLAQIPNIVCIKEAAGSMDQVTELKEALPESFAIYCGDDSLTLPMLALGAAGVVSVASHVIGNQIKKMISAFFNGQVEEALKWHLMLYPVFKGIFIATNPVPIKYLMDQIGFRTGGYRLPLVNPTDSEADFLNKLLLDIQKFPENI